jgi:hypothetical protein
MLKAWAAPRQANGICVAVTLIRILDSVRLHDWEAEHRVWLLRERSHAQHGADMADAAACRQTPVTYGAGAS